MFKFRHLLSTGRSCQRLISAHSRKLSSTSVLGASEKMEHLENNPLFEKYKDKIKKLQESSPDEFQAKVETMLESKKQKQTPGQPLASPSATSPSSNTEREGSVKSQLHKPKGLDGVMKLELIKDKSAEEIAHIWKEYHKTKDGIFAVINGKDYEEISKRSAQYSTFLFPVPRSEGYEFIVVQFSGHQCYFTPLIAFQNYKDNAPPCLTMTHYTELQQEKGIVLMSGEYDDQMINTQDATILAQQVQMYYGPQGTERFKLVEKMHKQPNDFKHADVIAEFENITAGQFVGTR